MENLPLQTQELKKPNIFQQIFGWKPKDNFFREVNNLLASRAFDTISNEDLALLEQKYKTSLPAHRKQLASIYQVVLDQYLQDHHLSEEERNQVRQLAQMLELDERDIRKADAEAYQKMVQAKTEDHELDPEEKEFLLQLRQDLELPEDLSKEIYSQTVQEIFEEYSRQITQDEMISPQEEEELFALANRLHIDVDLDEKNKKLFAHYKLLWRIHNGELPEVETRFNLYKNETCHFSVPANLYEMKTVTKRINYSGPTARIKIMDGIYWRAGSMAPQRVTEEVMKKIDGGQMLITNKRVQFVGQRSSKRTRLNRIMDFEPYSNGVAIYKDSGKPLFFEVNQNTDLMLLILGKAISLYQG